MWGVWIGFGIVCAGTIIGEIVTYLSVLSHFLCGPSCSSCCSPPTQYLPLLVQEPWREGKREEPQICHARGGHPRGRPHCGYHDAIQCRPCPLCVVRSALLWVIMADVVGDSVYCHLRYRRNGLLDVPPRGVPRPAEAARSCLSRRRREQRCPYGRQREYV